LSPALQTIQDAAHIRSFQFGIFINDLIVTLFPPYGVVKSNSGLRMLDSSAAGHVVPIAHYREDRPGSAGGLPGIDAGGDPWRGTAHPSTGGPRSCLARHALMMRVSAGSRMTEITDILFPQIGQRNGSTS